ncbi:MAG: type II toxin-antitoxin system HicB family antitoxin [Spirochaetaceae bacterium]|nr:type II toxin-antitoxin system HicB family antitoxin [Spirochaetaceae bacterium]
MWKKGVNGGRKLGAIHAVEAGDTRTVICKDLAVNLTVVLDPSDDGGFTAVVPSLPGCISEGDTREEAVANVREAIELYLEPADDDAEFSERAELIEVVA